MLQHLPGRATRNHDLLIPYIRTSALLKPAYAAPWCRSVEVQVPDGGDAKYLRLSGNPQKYHDTRMQVRVNPLAREGAMVELSYWSCSSAVSCLIFHVKNIHQYLQAYHQSYKI